MFLQKLYLVLLLVLVSPLALLAQQSGIVGTVTDSSGAMLPGASVVAKNINTGETRQATSNAVGQFAIPNLQAGVYEVTAEKQGFRRQLVEKVTLEVQALRTIDLMLPPGTVSEQVNVTAAATALQTTESSVSTLFESKVVSEIPLNGRDFLQLQLLSPGTTLASAGTFTAVQIASQNLDIGGGNFSVNGMRDVYNDYIIDGVSFKDWMHGTNGLNPSVDAIQEFRLQTGNYSAEFGANAGGLVNMVTKSGTNQIHGNLYDFLRNDKLDATNFFTGRAGEQKTPLRRNQFGGTVGGPIIRDRTFFFFSYEGFREQSSTTLFDNFPTQLMRSGDFSELLSLPTPVIISDPATGLPYPGNVIPPDQVLSVMPGYLNSYVPLPNRPGLVNNYIVPGSHSNDVNQYIGRVDHQLKKNLQLSGHYIYDKISDAPPTTNENFSVKQHNGDHNVSLHLTDTASPTTVFDLQFGYNLFKQFVIQKTANTSPNIASAVLGINGVATDPRSSGTPIFITPGFGVLSDQNSAPRQWFSERYEYQGSVSLVRGNHLIRAGLHTVRHHETFQETYLPAGFYVFDGSLTGYSMADMLLGIPSNFQLSPQLFDPQFRQWEIMPWVQDDWRVTPKLTINLGLRYEWRPWPVSKDNTISNITLPPGGGQASLVLSGPCVPGGIRDCATTLPTSIAPTRSTIASTDKNNFAPRIGFAYRVGDSGRTVVRGAYGMFYQAEPFNQFVFLGINPPFVSYYNRFINTGNFQNWDWFHPTAGLPPGGVQFTYIPSNSTTPYLQAWNFGVQHDFGAGFVLDTTYVGNKDTKLWARTWPNQPRPGPGDIDSRRPYTNVSTIAGDEPIGNANYNGLQMRLDKRFSQGLSILAGYTYSKAITDTQGAETGAFVPDLQDNDNRRANRGLTASDTRHRFTMSALYELPFGNKKHYLADANGVVRTIVSGWQLAGIATFQTGQPLTATLPFDNSNVGEGAKLPNLIGNPNNGPRTVDEFFNTAAFAAPPQFTFGNEGIDVITGPGIKDVDLSLVKNTPIGERMNLQFRCEAFNAGNHPIFAQPNATFGTPQFGQITGTRLDNREVQFALKLSF
ncbi:MAG: carboxypeptidase regulatory-like domain-containing protein [Terriglobales bacterium]